MYHYRYASIYLDLFKAVNIIFVKFENNLNKPDDIYIKLIYENSFKNFFIVIFQFNLYDKKSIFYKYTKF